MNAGVYHEPEGQAKLPRRRAKPRPKRAKKVNIAWNRKKMGELTSALQTAMWKPTKLCQQQKKVLDEYRMMVHAMLNAKEND